MSLSSDMKQYLLNGIKIVIAPEEAQTDALVFNELCLKYADLSIAKQDDDLSWLLEEIIPLEMPGVNPRIDAQSGLLLFSPKFLPIWDALCINFVVKKDTFLNGKTQSQILNGLKDFEKEKFYLPNASIIKINFKYTFSDVSRKILEAANVNARTIFPDETGIAKSIEYW